jgi:hypothetical protein
MAHSPRVHAVTISRGFQSALGARILLCACAFVLLAGAFGAAQAQVIQTVAGGFNPFNPITSPNEHFCEPIRAVANHGTDVYLTSCNQIFKVDLTGKNPTVVVAGNGITGFSGDGGPATSASLGRPHSISLDGPGNLYIYDESNFRIREVLAP